MSDQIVSLIRTVVPTIVGTIVAVLVSNGIDIDAVAQANLIGFMTALFTAIYYFIVRKFEAKYPRAGVLLGFTKQPKYE